MRVRRKYLFLNFGGSDIVEDVDSSCTQIDFPLPAGGRMPLNGMEWVLNGLHLFLVFYEFSEA